MRPVNQNFFGVIIVALAIICDIDGTIANLNHRLHYVQNGNKNWDKFFDEVSKDRPIWPIIDIVQDQSWSYEILLVSGRPEKTRTATESWLKEYNVVYDKLYMRPDNDTRKDTIIKSQILDGIISDGYEIKLVIDDRPTVIEMWKERGLFVLACPWHGDNEVSAKMGVLTLMVGPSGAGKSTWISNNINPAHVVSSDQIRFDLCGDFKDQSKNDQVFHALHAVVKTRIINGLPAVVDATNIRNKDRRALVDLVPGANVRYIVIDRPLEEKIRDAGWRVDVPGLIERHHHIFQSNLNDILNGDGYYNVTVVDCRE